MDGRISGRPATGIISQANLKGKVDENGESHVFLAETFVEEFEVCDCVVGLEADFGDEVDDDDALDVAEL